MEINSLIPMIFYGVVLAFLLTAVAALWMRMGNVQGELGGLRAEVAGLKETVSELKGVVDTLITSQHEMQLQMQRNHYQLMMAILSHNHRPDGRPTFDLPPDFEPTPASD